jgi:hypothetical protein
MAKVLKFPTAAKTWNKMFSDNLPHTLADAIATIEIEHQFYDREIILRQWRNYLDSQGEKLNESLSIPTLSVEGEGDDRKYTLLVLFIGESVRLTQVYHIRSFTAIVDGQRIPVNVDNTLILSPFSQTQVVDGAMVVEDPTFEDASPLRMDAEQVRFPGKWILSFRTSGGNMLRVEETIKGVTRVWMKTKDLTSEAIVVNGSTVTVDFQSARYPYGLDNNGTITQPVWLLRLYRGRTVLKRVNLKEPMIVDVYNSINQ